MTAGIRNFGYQTVQNTILSITCVTLAKTNFLMKILPDWTQLVNQDISIKPSSIIGSFKNMTTSVIDNFGDQVNTIDWQGHVNHVFSFYSENQTEIAIAATIGLITTAAYQILSMRDTNKEHPTMNGILSGLIATASVYYGSSYVGISPEKVLTVAQNILIIGAAIKITAKIGKGLLGDQSLVIKGLNTARSTALAACSFADFAEVHQPDPATPKQSKKNPVNTAKSDPGPSRTMAQSSSSSTPSSEEFPLPSNHSSTSSSSTEVTSDKGTKPRAVRSLEAEFDTASQPKRPKSDDNEEEEEFKTPVLAIRTEPQTKAKEE